MLIGAALLSVFVLPVFVAMLPEALHTREILFSRKDPMGTLISLGWLGTLVLLPVFDVVLMVDSLKRRKMPTDRP